MQNGIPEKFRHRSQKPSIFEDQEHTERAAIEFLLDKESIYIILRIELHVY